MFKLDIPCLATGIAACAMLAACGAQPDETGGYAKSASRDPVALPVTGESSDAAIDAEALAKPDLSNPDCLSYGMMRTGLNSDGPSYPLPVFAPTVERRCVIAYRDNRADIFTILAAGDVPQPSRNARNTEPVFGVIPNAGGITSSAEARPDGIVSIRATTALGGQANADAMLRDGWEKPVIGKSFSDGLSASWRAITIEGDLSRAELERSINSLRDKWAPAVPGAKGNDRLDAMGAAVRWQDLPDGRTNLAEIGAPDLGVVRDKPQQASYIKLDKRGRQVTALVFHLQSDNGGCYRGILNDAGKLTKVRFYNPMQWDDQGVVKMDDFWPDRLAPRPMRVGSPRVQALLNAPDSGWDFDICRKAFAAQ